MDLSLWPRVRKLFVDWGYRGLKGLASSLGLELEGVARPYAGVRVSGCHFQKLLRHFKNRRNRLFPDVSSDGAHSIGKNEAAGPLSRACCDATP